MRKCTWCGKEMEEDEDCIAIPDSGDYYCYEDLSSMTIDNIANFCVGKDLIKCGYTKENIIKKINEEEVPDMEFEIFYTTIPD